MSLYISFECESCENENCTGKGLKSTVYKCGGYKHKQTNADRIRAMTDEELAEWYWWMLRYVQGYTDSRVALLDWLKQEAKE